MVPFVRRVPLVRHIAFREGTHLGGTLLVGLYPSAPAGGLVESRLLRDHRGLFVYDIRDALNKHVDAEDKGSVTIGDTA